MIVLGLGSNQGNRERFLQSAIAELKSILTNTKLSNIYESSALLPDNAPPEWNIKFLNMAITGECELSPQELLTKIKEIEIKLGRKYRGHWSPREIDIDILAYNNLIINEEALQIPHKFLAERDFAIIPFAEIYPDWIHPIIGKSALELSNVFNDCKIHLYKTNNIN